MTGTARRGFAQREARGGGRLVPARDQIPGPAQLALELALGGVVGRGRHRRRVRARLRQSLGVRRVERQDHAALVDALDLGRVHEAVPARPRARVEHDAVEDVLVRLGQHVLDLAEPPAVARVDGHALAERHVRAGRTEILHRLLRTRPWHGPCITPGDSRMRFPPDRPGSRPTKGRTNATGETRMAKDMSDTVRDALAQVVREAVKNAGGSSQPQKKSSPLSGARGVAAGAGVAALAPLAKKGVEAVRGNGISLPSARPGKLAAKATGKTAKKMGDQVGGKLKEGVTEKVDEAGGAGGLV